MQFHLGAFIACCKFGDELQCQEKISSNQYNQQMHALN